MDAEGTTPIHPQPATIRVWCHRVASKGRCLESWFLTWKEPKAAAETTKSACHSLQLLYARSVTGH